MPYTAGFYRYLFVAGVVVVVLARLLSPLGLLVNLVFAVAAAYLAIIIGGECSADKICKGETMVRYLYRSCPRCNGYLGIVLRGPGRNVPLQAVNSRCTRCSYRMAWIVIRGKGSSSDNIRKASHT